jgi:hypothetical protein
MGNRKTRKREILQRGRTPGSYTAWPHACAKSANYKSLSAHAKALLLDFLGQFTGYNNGDLCCAMKLMKKCGWRSRTTVEKARAELEQKGWIVRTLQGWRHKPNLYALTMFKIDNFEKLEVRETTTALGFWQEGRNPWLDDQKSTRPRGAVFSSSSIWATQEATGTPAGHLNPFGDPEEAPVA